MGTKLQDLYTQQGQSPWLDFIRRNMLIDGGLKQYVDDGIRGVTANPTIFAQAIGAGDDYDAQIADLVRQGVEPRQMFEQIALQDIRQACDILRPVFDSSGGADGFVSIEVSPEMAFNTQGTIDEARSWWKQIDRPNLLVKIPATTEGIPAIEECLATGVNINITLIFALDFYERVMEAYLRALERRLAAGQDLTSVNSVASFFVSRVDTMTDKKLDAKAKDAGSERERALAKQLRSKLGIANARLAFQAFEETFGGARFAPLANKGVKRQKPLWASTSTKDPSLPDLYYVEALIAPDTVDTMPPETLEAYRDHGDPKIRIADDLTGARASFRGLEELGIDEAGIFRDLEEEGIRKFSDSYDSLMKTLGEKQKAVGVA